jgi:hypothetical protein
MIRDHVGLDLQIQQALQQLVGALGRGGAIARRVIAGHAHQFGEKLHLPDELALQEGMHHGAGGVGHSSVLQCNKSRFSHGRAASDSKPHRRALETSPCL